MNLFPLLRLPALRTFPKGQRRALSVGIVLMVLTITSCGDERGASFPNLKAGYVEHKHVDPSPVAVASLKPSLATNEADPARSKLPSYELKIGQKELAAMERTAY